MKNDMDSVFAMSAEDELTFDSIFDGDQDDAMCEAVEGFDEDGNSLLGDSTFEELHQTEDDNVTVEDIRDELGEGNDVDCGAKDVEGTKDVDLNSANALNELEKNGESDADKFIEDAEDDYQDDKYDEMKFDGQVTPDIEAVLKEAEGDEGPLKDEEDGEYDPEDETVDDNHGDYIEQELAVSDVSVTGCDPEEDTSNPLDTLEDDDTHDEPIDEDEDESEDDEDEDEDEYTEIEYSTDDEEELIKLAEK